MNTKMNISIWMVLMLIGGSYAFAGINSTPVVIDQTVPGTTNKVSLGSDTVTVTGPLTDAQIRATALPVSGTVTATGPVTDTQLRASAVPVSGPVTDAQLRASAVPISAATLPLPSGAAISAKQPALGTAGSPSADVITVQGNASGTPIPVTSVASFATRSDTFTVAANGTTVDKSAAPLKSFALAVKATGAVTSWTVVLECSLDNTNFTTVLTHTNVTPADGQALFAGTSLTPCMYFRSRVSAITLGGGTNVIATILGM